MNAFLQRHAKSVTGILRGWDRLRFRGTLRVLASVSGLYRFLSCRGHLLKDFKEYAQGLSQHVRGESLAVAQAARRPVEHLIVLPFPRKTQPALLLIATGLKKA